MAVAPAVRIRTAGLAFLAVAAVLAAGCTRAPAAAPQPSPTSPFAACPTPQRAASTGDGLPTLPCFTGGAPVALAGLGRPAVINLWASWCPPCREELPALQAFADEAGDRVLVLGVVTDDPWDRAAWIGIELGIRFPSVFDPEQILRRQLGIPGLPVTLFVAADGSIRGRDISGALTLEKLRALAGQHLGYGP